MDCFSTSACLPFCGSAETQGQDTVGLPQFPLPCAANTDPVAKTSLVDGVQSFSQISLFFCSFLGIPCNDRTFKCGNDVCIRKQNAKCDGNMDCPDRTDEEGCRE